jgi:hypothetical protein
VHEIGDEKVIAKLARQYQSKPKVCLTSSHLGRLGTGFNTAGNKRRIHFGSTV